MADLQDALPPGWESRTDFISGKTYYINHNTKTTTWDDPRARQKHSTSKHVEYIPLQHGSPDLRRNYVYPSQISPIPAFQISSTQNPKCNALQELRSSSRLSPLTVRGAKVQDSSLTIQSETDDAVSKISAMFPTVSETHIRLLMKKYHNREALVISALQVEKNPITTPGPFATPPPQRNIHHPGVHALQMTPPLGLRPSSRGGSPVLRPGSGGTNSSGSPRVGDAFKGSPRPHSSPKLKLRYMKSIFPQADETVILDVLYNNESNIQKVSEILIDMGFNRKDTVKAAQQKMETKIEEKRIEEVKKNEPPPPPPKIKTKEEKAALKEEMKKKYADVPEHLIKIALESVDFNESRAIQILEIIVQEDTDKKAAESAASSSSEVQQEEVVAKSELKVTEMPTSQSRQSIKSLLKADKIDKDKTAYSRLVENMSPERRSPNIMNTQGPNADLIKGPNSKILLEDYVNWQGPNSNHRKGPQALSRGPNRSLLSQRTYQACGSNPELRKGPKQGLAKGSIFSQLKNVAVGGESRGK
ncbi:uncharacterized protein LOC656340 isoform X1 [Tribolium castaneum]|uniref:uncharacterized protein LOC656340 isoform X1 n=1 Tax=Tribolium castaneum TaxID=7070 RepID=UPI00077DD93E|nr:PREDICTED: uncharacterized protein LOC656340 isoform X2 [Tribolium castaneum]|eukprot:XP_015834079.1 PREDICTED: uncharacterized protein LOC656340 isoform X2 [Tribolium castaneum]